MSVTNGEDEMNEQALPSVEKPFVYVVTRAVARKGDSCYFHGCNVGT